MCTCILQDISKRNQPKQSWQMKSEQVGKKTHIVSRHGMPNYIQQGNFVGFSKLCAFSFKLTVTH